MDKMVIVKFIKCFAPYVPGDVVGFDESDVIILEKTGVIERVITKKETSEKDIRVEASEEDLEKEVIKEFIKPAKTTKKAKKTK